MWKILWINFFLFVLLSRGDFIVPNLNEAFPKQQKGEEEEANRHTSVIRE